MTAPTFPDVTRGPAKFFEALRESDQRIAERDELVFKASFAPPVTTYARCTCGSTFESRCSLIAITGKELHAAAAAADGDLALAIAVIEAINEARAAEDFEALRDWEELHDYCGEEL